MEDMSHFGDIYPSLSELGISPQLLLAVVDDSDNDLEALNVESVTNRTILELYNFLNRNPSCTYYTLWRWIHCLFPDSDEQKFPTIKSIRQSIVRLSARLSTLKKMPSSSNKVALISEFLDQPYTLPRVFVSHGKVIVSSSEDSSCSSCSSMKSMVKESKKKMYATHRNGQKRLKRRDELIRKQDQQIREDQDVIARLEKKAAKSEEQVTTLRAQIDRLRHRATYWRSKCKVLKSNSDCSDDMNDVQEQEQERQGLIEEIRALEQNNIDLKDQVNDLMTDKIVTFEGGRYTDDVRTCCYELLSLNVGVNNVQKVIECVLTNIAHKEVDRLPKKTAVCDMLLECLTVAQAQLGEELSQDDGAHYTLQSDGTTKHGEHFSTFDIATVGETFALGLRHVFSGSAQSTLDTLLEILDDLDVVRKEIGKTSVSAKIISKVKNTMSDRHSAEKLFSTILSEYRASILPDIVEGWAEMSDGEHEHIVRMNNFFCGLHFLVGLADAAEETLKLWETANTEEEEGPQGKKSSGTQTLVRTACKAFHHRGSEQAGCSTHFRTYLRQKGVMRIPLASFVGNRFNILFYDAAGVYYLRSHMLDYLSNYHGADLNHLLKSVLKDLKSPLFTAGCKALGIIDKVVTGPFWRYLQASSVSILEMSKVYTKMRDQFEKWGEDAQKVLDNEVLLFPDTTSYQDDVMDSLYTETDNDHLVQELLQLLFQSFTLTIERLLIDHLPGGEFHNVTDPAIISETLSVPKTNVVPERDFAVLDRLMSQKPNATHIALEATILFSQNKTSKWFKEKSLEERERLLQAARKLTKVHRRTFKARKEEIKAKRLKLLEQRQKELAKKKERELKEKEQLTLEIQSYGLWTTSAEVQQQLKKFKTKKSQVEALKSQISFRRKVLNQSGDKYLFQFSHNHRALTVDQLAQNLGELLLPKDSESCRQVPSHHEIKKDPELLLYRRVKHLFNVDDSLEWYHGTVISYDPVTKNFRVAYDDEEEVYSFPLLEDLESGDLHIL